MTREQFFDKLATEPLYFRYDFEDVVIITVPLGKDDLAMSNSEEKMNSKPKKAVVW